MKPQIIINNELRTNEKNFVISAWIQVALGSKTFSGIKRATFYAEMSLMILNALSDSDVKVIMARNIEDEDQLYGCIVYSKNSILFCYVKGIYRELGLFSEMCKRIDSEMEYYCIDSSYSKVLKKVGLEYNPFKFFKFKKEN